MKRSIPCVFLLLATLCLTGCSLNFQDFSAPDGSYSVKMPGTPVKTPTPGASGEAWEVVTGRWNFGVASMDLPSEAAGMNASQQALAIEMGAQSMASALRATTKSSTNITLNGFHGKEVELSVPAGPNSVTGKSEPATSAVMRLYIVNSKLLVVMARSSNSITKDSPDVKTFFDSFKLNASSTSSTAGMAGMPGGTTPSAGPGMSPPGMTPPGTPPATTTSPPGYPVADANTAGYPAPGTTPGYPTPSATYPMPGATPMPGTTPMPGATYPMPGATYPMPGTATPMPGATYPMPGATTPMPGTTPPMPGATYPNPNGTTPNATAQGFNAPAGTPYGNVPGQPGNQPAFTGEPVTDETKIAVGDMLQIYFNNQWIDVKVQRVSPTGLVQVRSQTKPPIIDTVPRNLLQKPPGADVPQVAANSSPRTDPSGLPNSKSSGFSKPGASSGFANSEPADSPSSTPSSLPKSRSSGFAKSTETKPESTSKSPGLVSLDGATVEELLAIIGKKTEHRKVPAAEKLRDHSDAGPTPEVAKKILDLMKTDELTVRAALAQALEKWACPEIHGAVVKNLTGGTTEVRQSMIKILATSDAEDSAERIAQRLADKDDRKVAAEALLSMGEPAQAAVIKMLDHRDSKVKTTACDILMEIGSADAITALTKATSNWTGTDRLAARKALKALEAKQ